MRNKSSWLRSILILVIAITEASAQDRAPGSAKRTPDRRHGELQNLNGYFPFTPVADAAQWPQRQAQIRRRILVSQGLWPLPTKTELNAVIHGRVERDDYVVDRVIFESAPGHFVTGSLYRPKGNAAAGSLPVILSPHGHWKQGRFYDAGEAGGQAQIDLGAETQMNAARFPLQARAVQLARMGCLVFLYDMTGEADSVQISHRPAKWSHLDRKTNWGFMSVQADLRLQNMMGLQTWNSIRAIDFVLQLDETDPDRIGVTGASGGGTQSMIIGAVDERIRAAMPCVMVSTSMQGGCTCENAPLMRIDQGNIDIAAAIAPRPLGLTAADDWTVELETKGFPDLLQLYKSLGHEDHLTAVFHTQFKHNYNLINRREMYAFFNRHFGLGQQEPIDERDFKPLSREEATVWTGEHPAPTGDNVGDAHEIRLLRMATHDSDEQLRARPPVSSEDLETFLQVIGGGWETLIGRTLAEVGEVRFVQSTQSSENGRVSKVGVIEHVAREERIPTSIVRSETISDSRGTVIWISDTGRSGLGEGQYADQMRQLVDAGYTLISADLFGQGDSEMADSAAQPMWYQRGGDQGWHRFSGYTFGYNHCVFAKRVHDVLSLVKYGKQEDRELILIGMGEIAGPVALAARSQADDSIGHSYLGWSKFRFNDLDRHDHPMFVPGAVKYLGLEGLTALCIPAKLTLIGQEPSTFADRVYDLAGRRENLMTRRDSDFPSIIRRLSEGDR